MSINTEALGRTTIERNIWKIQRVLLEKYGTAQAASDVAPLVWYIETGRASADYLRKLFAVKPFLIARRLHLGGSYDEVLARVGNLIGWTQERK